MVLPDKPPGTAGYVKLFFRDVLQNSRICSPDLVIRPDMQHADSPAGRNFLNYYPAISVSGFPVYGQAYFQVGIIRLIFRIMMNA